jgi:hypothetical protein
MNEKTFNSEFAILDVKKGRGHLRNRLAKGEEVPVIIYGHIGSLHSKDDGLSQEFAVAVDQAIEVPWDKEAPALHVADMDYDRQHSMALRDNVIQLRDSALSGGYMEWAVSLSHTIAWMAVVIEERWPEKVNPER